MAFSNNNKKIAELRNSEDNEGFIDADGVIIRECADFIATSADGDNTCQNAKNISNTFGNILAWLLNAVSADPAISAVNVTQLLVMYLYLADAPYKGYPVEYRLHTFDPANPIEAKCISDLKRMRILKDETGMEKDPESILELSVKGRVIGMYFPKWKCFVPGTGFRESAIYGLTPAVFMKENPHAAHRCRAILTTLLENGAFPQVLEKALEYMGGPVPENEMLIYKAEMAQTVPGDVAAYIHATSDITDENGNKIITDPGAVCGYMGTNYSDMLLDTPVLINTGTRPMKGMNRSLKTVGDNLVIIPPVQNVNSITDVSYSFGTLDKEGIPEWVDFSARLNGVLYHRIYAYGFKTCQPDNIIDLAYMVPDSILAKYNYLVQGSAASSMGLDDIETTWKPYPEDVTDTVVKLTSLQYAGEWEIHQRSTRIDRLELCDRNTGKVLGTIIPEKSLPFRRANNTSYISLDPAGAVSVRLKHVAGSGNSEALEYSDMTYPITPMAKSEFEQAVERRMIPPYRTGTHFDSLLQRFFSEGSGTWSSLMVESRIWKPDEKGLFDALKAYPGTMTEAMTALGVISNMKEMLTHSGLRPADKQMILMALKSYIGTMILEGVLALAREGFSFHGGNLEFLISFPENSTGEGITKMMKDAVRGAIAFVNEYLDSDNQLRIGTNVFLYSESKATAFWHQINPPRGTFMGKLVATGTPDYGHSTHDFSLRVKGKIYMFSIPYAAQRITNATLAKVYEGNAKGIMRCFSGGSQELKRQAQQAMEEAMKSNHGKLYERLGFILPLNRLFSNCQFNVTGVNADSLQMKVQELTEAKLNIAIPAYAYTIVRAMKDGCLSSENAVLLAPVGRGSLAINNTAPGFEMRFTRRLRAEIDHLIRKDGRFPQGTVYTGKIMLLPNNDTDKTSVAQGMIEIKENGGIGEQEVIVPFDPIENYLNMVYGYGEKADEEAKAQFREKLDALAGPANKLEYNAKHEELYHAAFDRLVDSYTYPKFEEAFNRFGYTGIEEGILDVGVLDENIRRIVSDQFENLCAQLKQEGEDLIMSCPGVEEEMFCGALMDLAIDRMTLFPEDE